MKYLFSAICLLLIGSAHAADTFYTDVPPGIWYEESVKALLDAGYLDGTQQLFRPEASATRAEVLKLIVELNGGVLTNHENEQAPFADVSVTDWYFPYFAEAKDVKWINGDDNCAITNTQPCTARPNDVLTRAEALALIVRAFNLEEGHNSRFKDYSKEPWFEMYVDIVVDNCLIDPPVNPEDGSVGSISPLHLLNRAELVQLLYRVDQHLAAGTACG